MTDETQNDKAGTDPRALTMICLACAAVAIAALVIDLQIAKNLAQRARELDEDYRGKRWDNEISRMGGTVPGPSFRGNHGGHPVDRNPGMEAGADTPNSDIPMEGWDVFRADRTHTHRGPGSRNLAIPENDGTMEPK